MICPPLLASENLKSVFCECLSMIPKVDRLKKCRTPIRMIAHQNKNDNPDRHLRKINWVSALGFVLAVGKFCSSLHGNFSVEACAQEIHLILDFSKNY